LVVAATIELESAPPLWWDEGWTLTVARTWVERGHYGRLLDGQLAPPGLEAAFPVTAPIALSFRLLGVGVWQGRLVGVLFTLGTLALIYYLALHLYDRSVAIGTLIVLLFMSMHPDLHPVLMGRQVLAELPMLFYLLAGYACFLLALRQSLWFIPAVMIFWGIALVTKAQVLPFWIFSLLIPLLMMLFKRNWKLAGLIGISLSGSCVASQLFLWLQQLLLQGHTLAVTPIHGLYDVTAFVPMAWKRLQALIMILTVGSPALPGLCYTAWQFLTNRANAGQCIDVTITRIALLTLACSWLAWYAFFSVAWPRYLFPATFMGSMFTAALLADLTNGFRLSSMFKHTVDGLRHLQFRRQSSGGLLAILLIATASSVTLQTLYRSYVLYSDASALRVADFLNTHTAPNALIETYDSELFFLLDRRYHYPPDQIHVELNRRTFLGQAMPIDYNPLTAEPDYLVVGRHSKLWQLYNPVLRSGSFQPLRTYGRYDIYQRVR
jgi:hypothetical protein